LETIALAPIEAEILFIFLQHSGRKIKRLQRKAGHERSELAKQIAPNKKAHFRELLFLASFNAAVFFIF